MKKLAEYWYWILIGIFLAGVIILYAVCGTGSYIQVQDNLDLFTAQYQMLKNTHTFFAHGVSVPFLGGVSRDTLPSELSLTSVLYMLMPSFAAYVTGYVVKIFIAVVSFMLLSGELLDGRREYYMPVTVITGFAYGILNLFPAFGIPFASIPLVIYLFIKAERTGRWYWYLLLFCYPFISYFSYFGLFICAYALIGLIWVSAVKRRFSLRMLTGLIAVAAGYVVFEYRLFGMMLFGSTVTIRATMRPSDLSAGEVIAEMKDVFLHGIFHADAVHTRFILPLCIGYLIFLNVRYIVRHRWKDIFHDIYNLTILIIIFNCVIYGLQDCLAFSTMVAEVCPPLKGWQFDRTVFFNPFLWYAAFFIILKRMYDSNLKGAADLLAVIAVFVILLTPDKYNDLYRTCRCTALSQIKGTVSDEMDYREFYASDLYDEIKADIGYNGEWSAAYGFHPAQLEYNGIATLDGYLGFYPQSYKEQFRKVIAPALERVEESRAYYDDWGAKAYLYGGTDVSIVSNSKSFDVTDNDIYIDTDAFGSMGGKYIFSRYELANAGEKQLELVRKYTVRDVPYAVWLYKVSGEHK